MFRLLNGEWLARVARSAWRWVSRELFGTFDGTEEEFWDRQW
jgi:hypothetical protein